MGASRKLEASPSPELQAQWAQEVERARALVHDLRNPIGAIALATELLQGPLSKVQAHLDASSLKALRRTLEALECAVEQAVHLVRNEHVQPRPALHVVSEQGQGEQDLEGSGQGSVAQAPPTKPEPTRAQASDSDNKPQGGPSVDVTALLRKLEILVVTRSSLPALLAISATPSIRLNVHGAELMRALSNLVENAIEASAKASPSAGPWTVELRCAIQEDGRCLFLVRNEGEAPPQAIVDWLLDRDGAVPPASSKEDGGLHGVGLRSVRRILADHGGGLSVTHKDGSTEFQAWIPAERVLG